ncbi:porin family protein [Alteromonas australica]|uniref:porin family protein n=1 Tax=Alteromonas australica TaxID=589873 RepID=UPI0035C86DA8
MKNTLTAIASIAALTSFGTYAQSSDYPMDDSGFYVGGNYGYLKAEGEDDFDDDKDVRQGLLGYKFNEWVALEGSYIDFGDYGSDLAGAETDGYTAAVKGILPISDRFSLYAKVGQLWSETEYNFGTATGDYDDESLFVGAGISYEITRNFLVNAEYTVYDTTLDADEAVDDIDDTDFETDLKQASLGIEYRF